MCTTKKAGIESRDCDLNVFRNEAIEGPETSIFLMCG